MTGSRARTIHIVDDDEGVRRSLAALLRTWGYETASYADGESFLDAAALRPGDAVLLDVRLPDVDGLSVVKVLRARGAAAPVVMITGHGDVALAVRALKSGAQDFVEKPFDGEDLVRRIETASGLADAAGGGAAGPGSAFGRLTPRETEVMRHVVAGHPNKVIAHRLGLSPKTVEVHRARVMDKTGAANLSSLVRLAVKAGIEPEE